MVNGVGGAGGMEGWMEEKGEEDVWETGCER